MKIQILSDIHNEFSVLPLPITDADVIVLAGDIDVKCHAIEWAKGFPQPVLYVLGNHEFYGSDIDKIKAQTRDMVHNTNIILLDDTAVTIEGVRFIGSTLWTDFALFGEAQSKKAMLNAELGLNDFKVIKTLYRKLLPRDTLSYYNQSVGFIQDTLRQPHEGQTVVITHHAPSAKSVAPIYENDPISPCFASHLETLIKPPVSLWIHGHVHNSNDYQINNTRVVSNPRGYQFKGDLRPENSDFKANFCIEL